MISFEYVSNQIWAIKEENLRTILEITSRTNPSLEAIEAKLGQKLANKRETTTQDGVKVIEVRGPIIRYGNVFTQVSGATSLSEIQNDFKAALADDSVDSILFDIDSPGGEASGIEEFAEQIYQARGTKPMVSYVSNMACSAAYWIASATDKIIAGKTATVGSIGCVAVMRDTEEKDAMEGVKNIKFISNNSPNKRPDVSSDEGKSLIQEQIDAIGDIFIETMARNRSSSGQQLSFNDVINNFNKGGVLIGKNAVKAGLVDELGSLESTLYNLTGGDLNVLANEKETSMKLENENMKKVEEETHSGEELVIVKGEAQTAVPSPSLEEFNALKESNQTLATKLEEYVNKLSSVTAMAIQVEEEKLNLEASSKVSEFKDKMIPAQVEGNTKLYIQASKDDKANPIEGFSRVNTLVETWSTTPSHKLKEELLEDDLSVLENNTEAVDEQAEMYASIDSQVEAYLATKKGTNK